MLRCECLTNLSLRIDLSLRIQSTTVPGQQSTLKKADLDKVQLEPVIWLRDTGHIGIHGGVDGRTVAG